MTVVVIPLTLLSAGPGRPRKGLDLVRDGRCVFGWTVEYVAGLRYAHPHPHPRPRAVVVAGVSAAVTAQPDPDGPAVVVKGYTEYLNRLGFVPPPPP